MSDGTTMTSPYVLGVDLGDRQTHVCVLEDGHPKRRFKVETTAEAIARDFHPYVGAKVVMEAGAHSPWIRRQLAAAGFAVVVANPSRLALITRDVRKSDRNDAYTLAKMGKADVDLLRPIRHRSEDVQVHLDLLHSRDLLVRQRTQQINHVRGLVKAHGGRVPRCDAEQFAERGLEGVPPALLPVVKLSLEVVRHLNEGIAACDARVNELLKKYSATEQLRQVQGVGPLTSLAFVLVLEDPWRFSRSRKVGAYLGLTPKRSQSGEHDPQLRITKAGNGFLRRLLVQSAHYILGPFGDDTALRRVGEAIARRGGATARRKAVTAVARRLAVLLHRLWITGEEYEALRNAPDVPAPPVGAEPTPGTPPSRGETAPVAPATPICAAAEPKATKRSASAAPRTRRTQP
jgi:transposase